VDLQPEKFVAEEAVKEFRKQGSVENEKILVVRTEVTRDILAPELTKMGAIVDEAVAYRTVPETEDVTRAQRRFRAEGADMVTFTSSSSVENFMALKLPLPEGLKTASIGPATSQTLRGHGLKVDAEAARHDIAGLVKTVRDFFTRESR
jgi:uroporphyrinogen III methyltransferase/synthase